MTAVTAQLLALDRLLYPEPVTAGRHRAMASMIAGRKTVLAFIEREAGQ